MAGSRGATPGTPRARKRAAAPRAAASRAPEETLEPLPELAMGQLVPTLGYFPSRDQGPATNALGMVRTFAGNLLAFGTARADGRLLPLKSNEPLFAVLGNRFGGEAGKTFALPDLRGRTAIGGPLEARDGGGAALPLTHMIAVDAPRPDYSNRGMPTPVLGSIGMFAGDFAPGGWLSAEGQLLEVARYPELARLLGSTFGGDGRTGFALPDLKGRAVIGAGWAPYSGQRLSAGLGEVVRGAGGVAALGLNYLICIQGAYPDYRGDGAFPDESVIGEVIPFAGADIPAGWALADGRSLEINQNQALYSVFGESYGGDGRRTFRLPRLTGCIVVGTPAGAFDAPMGPIPETPPGGRARGRR